MSRFVVVGGGLSGLSSAVFVKSKFPKASVFVLEASDRLGGWIKSKKYEDGAVHELGPRTIRMQSNSISYLLQIIEDINVYDKIIAVSKTDKNFHKRYIFAHNQLNLLDFSIFKPAYKPFTESFLFKLFKFIIRKNKHGNEFQDLSVDDFARSRFDSEIADYIINPIIRGIYACDSKDLSIKSVFPFLLEMEKLGPNVLIGSMKYNLKNLFESRNQVALPKISKYFKESSVISFHGGIETMITALKYRLEEMGVVILTNSSVRTMKVENSNQITLDFQTDSVSCDHAILAVPSYVSSVLLNGIVSNNGILDKIHWNNIAVVVLEFKGRLIPHCGFGHLVPSWEIADTLGVIYDSCILPQNDCQGRLTTRYTVMLGGAWFYPSIHNLNKNELIDKALEIVKTQVGVKGELMRSSVAIHQKCIPVYGLNHENIVSSVRKCLIDDNLPIKLCGNSYDGVSLSDVVRSAHRAVESISV